MTPTLAEGTPEPKGFPGTSMQTSLPPLHSGSDVHPSLMALPDFFSFLPISFHAGISLNKLAHLILPLHLFLREPALMHQLRCLFQLLQVHVFMRLCRRQRKCPLLLWPHPIALAASADSVLQVHPAPQAPNALHLRKCQPRA